MVFYLDNWNFHFLRCDRLSNNRSSLSRNHYNGEFFLDYIFTALASILSHEPIFYIFCVLCLLDFFFRSVFYLRDEVLLLVNFMDSNDFKARRHEAPSNLYRPVGLPKIS